MDAYNKTNWIDNQTLVSADKLNKIEEQLAKLTSGKVNINDMQSKIEIIDLLAELLKNKQLSTNDFTDEYRDKLDNLQVDKNVEDINSTQGSIPLSTNTIYRCALSGNTTFVLPTNTDTTIINQILIQANITTDITVTWGTSLYFGDTVTTLSVGRYNIIFEHNGTDWVYGVLEIGG